MAYYAPDTSKASKKKEEEEKKERKSFAPVTLGSVQTESENKKTFAPITVGNAQIITEYYKQVDSKNAASARNATWIPNTNTAALNQNLEDQGLVPIFSPNTAYKPVTNDDIYERIVKNYNKKKTDVENEGRPFSSTQYNTYKSTVLSYQSMIDNGAKLTESQLNAYRDAQSAVTEYETWEKRKQARLDQLNLEIKKAEERIKIVGGMTDEEKDLFAIMAGSDDTTHQTLMNESAKGFQKAWTGGSTQSTPSFDSSLFKVAEAGTERDDAKQKLLDMGYTEDQIEEYLIAYKNVRNDEIAAQQQLQAERDARKHPIMSSLASIPMGLVGGVTGLFGAVVEPGVRNDPTFTALNNYSSTIQSSVRDEIENAVRKTGASEFWVKAAGYGYSGAMAAAQSAAAMGLGSVMGTPFLGEIVLGAGAASQAYNEALVNGHSYGDALLTGTIAGLIETLTEHLSLENLRALKATAGLKNLPINLVKSFITEGSEEIASDVLNEAWDYFAHGGLSEYEKFVSDYLDTHRGATEAEARQAYASQFGMRILESGIVGGISGLLGTGWTTTANGPRNYVANSRTGADYQAAYQQLLKQKNEGADVNPNSLYGNLLNLTADLPTDSRAVQNAANAKNLFTQENVTRKEMRRQGAIINDVANEAAESEPKSVIQKLFNVNRWIEEEPSKAQQYRIDLNKQANAARVESFKSALNKALEEQAQTDDAIKKLWGLDDAALKKSVDTETGITPTAIASIEDGKVRLSTQDGRIVDLADAKFKTEAEAAVYNAVAKLGLDVETANKLVSAIDYQGDASALQQLRAMDEVLTYAKATGVVRNGTLTDVLNDTQKNVAYQLGNNVMQAEDSNRQARIAKARASMVRSENVKIGGKKATMNFVGFKYTDSTVNDSQRAQMRYITQFARYVGRNRVVFYASNLSEDGKTRVFATKTGYYEAGTKAPHAFYDHATGDVYVDINAGNSGQGYMLFHAAHEYGHHIADNAPARFQEMLSYLAREVYGEKTTDRMIKAQLEKGGKDENGNYKLSSRDAAIELFCDAMQEMFTRGDIEERLAKLKGENPGLWQQFKDFVSKLLADIKAFYKKVDPESWEARELKKNEEAFQKLADMFVEASVEAGQNFEAAKTEGLNAEMMQAEAGIATAPDSGAPVVLSARTLLTDKQREKAVANLKKQFPELTEQDIKNWLDTETALASIILNPKYQPYLDYVADPNEKAIKQNSDYPQGTVDYSNICVKRRALVEIMNKLYKAMPNQVFQPEDLADILRIVEKHGIKTPCHVCYVEDRRQRDSIVADLFINSLDAYRRGESSLDGVKPFNKNQIKAFEMVKGNDYVPTVAELVTPEGRTELREKNPDMLKAWERFNNARGMQSVRVLLPEAEYRREIRRYSKKTVDSKNARGGLRIYSFSDFEMFHLIDLVQVLTDCAEKGLFAQGYTKVNEYARIMANTGLKLNRSLIPKGKLGYHIDAKTGKVVLDFDTVEGIDINSKDFFDNKDNPNIGNIVIGINAQQIRAAMLSDFIDQIIPFHTGQSAEVLKRKGIDGWQNYKDSQTDKVKNENGEWVTADKQINIYTDVIAALEAEGKEVTERSFTEKFLAVCEERGYLPRFSEFLDKKDGKFVYTKGYAKMLVDFKTFAHDAKGTYLPQGRISPNFDLGYMTEVMKGYANVKMTEDDDFRSKLPGVVKEITETVANRGEMINTDQIGDSVIQENEISLSARDEKQYKECEKKINDIVDRAIANGGDLGVPNNTEKVLLVPDLFVEMVKQSSGGKLDISEKYFALNGTDVWHEFKRHGGKKNENREKQNGQIAFTKVTFKNAIKALFSPDIVETLFADGNNPNQRASFAYAKRSAKGRYVVVEAIGGRNNPTIVPVMMVQLSAKKWNAARKEKKSLAEILYGHDAKTLAAMDIAANKKNQVTAAQIAKLQDAYSPRSPRSDDIISNEIENVKGQSADSKNGTNGAGLVSRSGRDLAPTFYSTMERTVENMKMDKIGAASVLSFLKGRGVKDEEIKWSGIRTFLEGKKSVTKEELQAFIAENKIQIETVMRDLSYDPDNYVQYRAAENFARSVARAKLEAEGKFVDPSRMSVEYGDNGEFIVTNASTGELLYTYEPEKVRVRWGAYALLGGKNYREFEFKLPGSDYTNEAMQTHWRDSGVIAHARVQDFETKNGDRVLFIEEIQSDWHNAGAKGGKDAVGFGKVDDTEYELRDEGQSPHNPDFRRYRLYANGKPTDYMRSFRPDSRTTENLYLVEQRWIKYYREENQLELVPDAPYAGASDSFIPFVLKNMIREAAMGDYDYIGWTTAAQQEERWKGEYNGVYKIEYDQKIKTWLKKYGNQWGAQVGDIRISSPTGEARAFPDTVNVRLMSDVEATAYAYKAVSDAMASVEDEWTQPDDYKELHDKAVDAARNFATHINAVCGARIVYESDFLDELDSILGSTFNPDTVKGTVSSWLEEIIQEAAYDYGYASDTTAVHGMNITEAMKESVLYEGQASFSARDNDRTDARTMLSNALIETAQTDAERDFLQRYQAKISDRNKDDVRLGKLRDEIREMMFAKGPRDAAYKDKMAKLQQQAKILSDRIARADKKLLEMESTKPLKRVLLTETKKAAEKARAQGKEAAEAKLNRKIERLEADIEHRKEMRQAGIDQRKSSDLRERIKSIRTDFIQKLKKDNTIPPALVTSVIDVIDMIDPTGADQTTKAAQKYRDGKRALLAMKNAYETLKTNKDISADFKSEFSQELADRIAILAEAIGDKPLREMNRAQLEDVVDALSEIRHTLQNAKNQIGIENAITNYQAGMSFVDNMLTVKKKKLNRGRDGNLLSKIGSKGSQFFMNWMTNPLRAVREMAGYDKNSQFLKLFEKIDEGLRASWFWEMKAKKLLEPFQTGKNEKLFEKASTTAYDFGITDVNGKKLKISKMQAMQILLTYERETNNENRSHLANQIIIPDVDYIAKGKYSEALDRAQKMAALDEDVIAKLRKGLNTEFDLAFMDAARKVFEMSANAVNEVSLILKGRAIATEKSYIPYEVFGDVLNNDFENVAFNIAIANMGMTKSVLPNSTKSLVMRGLDTVMDKHIKDTGKYYGLAIPVRNFTKAYSTILTSADAVDKGVQSAKDAIRAAWGSSAMELIEQAVADVQGSRPGKKGGIIDKMRSKLVPATLAFNLSVWMKQFASYPTAGSLLKRRSLARGLKYLGTDFASSVFRGEWRDNLWNEIDEHTAMHYIRRQGLSIQELAEFSQSKGIGKKLSKIGGHLNPMNWIQGMDVRTTAALWVACKAEIRSEYKKHGGEVGSEQYWTAVTNLYNKVIEDTQPMYDPLHRAEITKDNRYRWIMFQTQPIQNSGILREATMQFVDARKQYGRKSAQAKEAGKWFAKAVLSQLASHTMFSLLSLLGSGLALHKMKPYRDDDEEVTWESMMMTVLKNIAKAYFGAIFPVVGNILIEGLDKIISKNNYDVVSDMTLEAINSTWDTLSNLAKKAESNNLTVMDCVNAITDTAKFFGVPASNASNIVKSIFAYAKDIELGKIFESDAQRTAEQNKRRLYKAIVAGDQKVIDEYRQAKGDDWSSFVQTVLKEYDERIVLAAVALNDNDTDAYEQLMADIYRDVALSLNPAYTSNDVTEAVRSTVNTLRNGIKDLAQAKADGNTEGYEKKLESLIEDGFDADYIEQLVDAYELDDEDEDEPEAASLYKAVDINNAFAKGDLDKVRSMAPGFKTKDAYDSAVKSAMRKYDPRVKEAAQARFDGDTSEYIRLVDDIVDDGYFSQELVVEAIKAETSSIGKEPKETDPLWYLDEENFSGGEGDYDIKAEDAKRVLATGNAQDIKLVYDSFVQDAINKGNVREDAIKSAQNSFKTAIKNMFIGGDINMTQVTNYLKQYGGQTDENDIYWLEREWQYNKDNKNNPDAPSYKKYTTFYKAVQSGVNLKSVISEYTTHGVTAETMAGQITTYFKPIYKSMNNTERAALKGYLLNAYVALGYNRTKKSKDIDKWLTQ